MTMMTGRVLLVCALCVLWCGVCGGGLAEPTQDPQDITSGNGNNHQSVKNNAGGAGEGGLSGKPEALQAAGLSVTELPGAGAATKLPGAQTPPTAGTEKKNEETGQKKEEEDDKQQEEEKTKEDEKVVDKKEEEAEEDDEEDKDDDVKDEEEEEEQKKKKNDNGATKKLSAVGQEQPLLPSGAEGASNQTKPKSAQTTDVNDPAAEGAGTREEKQNENKEANPKKTPVEATGMKTTTATPADSDSSTAVSHTTFPLLLLLLVACAAAAVVAA
ncbi:Mucin-associated surface protein (MASP), subgroup S059 [Trypanosoma cruzi]|nr:Mucin-associated surface protein (MASP), subgroup S059 [Trypanosoma cruzi]